jgi:hypothetical protein
MTTDRFAKMTLEGEPFLVEAITDAIRRLATDDDIPFTLWYVSKDQNLKTRGEIRRTLRLKNKLPQS